MGWYVYILWCSDESLYTGITKDIERRVSEHNDGLPSGARYTHPRRPVTLVYAEAMSCRAEASRRENEIKALDRAGKLGLIEQFGVRHWH